MKEKVNAVVKALTDDNGLTIVMAKSSIVYGGTRYYRGKWGILMLIKN